MGSSASRPALWDVVLVRRTEGRTEPLGMVLVDLNRLTENIPKKSRPQMCLGHFGSFQVLVRVKPS